MSATSEAPPPPPGCMLGPALPPLVNSTTHGLLPSRTWRLATIPSVSLCVSDCASRLRRHANSSTASTWGGGGDICFCHGFFISETFLLGETFFSWGNDFLLPCGSGGADDTFVIFYVVVDYACIIFAPIESRIFLVNIYYSSQLLGPLKPITH